MIKKAIKKKEFWGCYLFAIVVTSITEFNDFVKQMGFEKAIFAMVIASTMGFFTMSVMFTCLETLWEKITSKFNR